MARFVPYLAEATIERNAEALLTEFAHARDVVIEPPIPIEDILEKHLKLGIEFDDTHRLFGIPRTDLGQGPDILARYFSMKSGLSLTKVSTLKSTRTTKAVIASPWHMREAVTGGFTAPFMPGTLRRQPYSAGHPSHPPSAGQVRQRSGSNGRRISMRPAS